MFIVIKKNIKTPLLCEYYGPFRTEDEAERFCEKNYVNDGDELVYADVISPKKYGVQEHSMSY